MQLRIVLCFSAVVIQTISASCLGNAFNGFGPAIPEFGLPGPYGPGRGCGLGGFGGPGPAFGPGPLAGPAIAPEPYIPAALASMPPPGMTIASDNLLIEGPVIVAGRMPFVGSATVEGMFATAGAGAVSYGCGDSAVGIMAETPMASVAEFGYGPMGCGRRMF